MIVVVEGGLSVALFFLEKVCSFEAILAGFFIAVCFGLKFYFIFDSS